MSIQQLKMLREQAWIPTALGDKFSLHFDDTLYLQLVAKHLIDEVAAYSCQSFGPSDLFAEGYQEGYNSAVQSIVQQLRVKYEK